MALLADHGVQHTSPLRFVAPPPAHELVSAVVASPIGPLHLLGRGRLLERLLLPDMGRLGALAEAAPRNEALLRPVIEQLEGYFAGDLKRFDVDLAPRGTAFQLSVWAALDTIPYGATASYGEIARLVGRPKAARAVGMANNKNPLPIVLPCHRVIGSTGALVGYGGGLEAKRFLLALEQRAR